MQVFFLGGLIYHIEDDENLIRFFSYDYFFESAENIMQMRPSKSCIIMRIYRLCVETLLTTLSCKPGGEENKVYTLDTLIL